MTLKALVAAIELYRMKEIEKGEAFCHQFI